MAQGPQALAPAGSAETVDSIQCPFGCGQWVPLAELDSHELAHAEEADFEALRAKYGFSNKAQRPDPQWRRGVPRLLALLRGCLEAGASEAGLARFRPGWRRRGGAATTGWAARAWAAASRATASSGAAGGGLPGGSMVLGADGRPLHIGVECDLCGQLPIRGARYRSLAAPNFDLCADCSTRVTAVPSSA
eukprot:XP_001697760.1 predicted protein [Chlamydomonas reinhardtii]